MLTPDTLLELLSPLQMSLRCHTFRSRYPVAVYEGLGARGAFPDPIIFTPRRLHSPISQVSYNKARRKVGTGNRWARPGVPARHDFSPQPSLESAPWRKLL